MCLKGVLSYVPRSGAYRDSPTMQGRVIAIGMHAYIVIILHAMWGIAIAICPL